MPNAQCSKDPFFSLGEGGGRVENGGGVGWRMGGVGWRMGGGVRRGVREGLGVCD